MQGSQLIVDGSMAAYNGSQQEHQGLIAEAWLCSCTDCRVVHLDGREKLFDIEDNFGRTVLHHVRESSLVPA